VGSDDFSAIIYLVASHLDFDLPIPFQLPTQSHLEAQKTTAVVVADVRRL